MQGGKKCTKLDLSKAYHQLELTPESKNFTTINTTKGLYQYNRLPFGVTSVVAIFQRTLENHLNDVPGCVVYIDDILITGNSDEEHLQNLRQVLNRLQEKGIKLKKDKFDFMLYNITTWGLSSHLLGSYLHKTKLKLFIWLKLQKTLQNYRALLEWLTSYVSSFLTLLKSCHHCKVIAKEYKLEMRS